ncbi:MAG: hypothetical protein H0X37_24755 [Herpetosiphonaceae bacterium]|nr:hypothetical protein [Herpetosiphonaceae bacterium]
MSYRVRGRLTTGLSLIAGLLLVRLVLLLFAVRPSNPVAAGLLWLSAPLVWPFGMLDQLAHQTRWGARLELATVAALVVLTLLIGVCHRLEQGDYRG